MILGLTHFSRLIFSLIRLCHVSFNFYPPTVSHNYQPRLKTTQYRFLIYHLHRNQIVIPLFTKVQFLPFQIRTRHH